MSLQLLTLSHRWVDRCVPGFLCAERFVHNVVLSARGCLVVSFRQGWCCLT